MQRILVSACLLGSPVRYNGEHKQSTEPILQQWLQQGRVVSVCPEVAGGLPVPRLPAELQGGDGRALWLAKAIVTDQSGANVTAAFVAGAEQALQLAKQHAIKLAVLKEGSPSCGSGYIYDGQFRGQRQTGVGVTAALLQQADVRVFSEHQWHAAEQYLQSLEQ